MATVLPFPVPPRRPALVHPQPADVIPIDPPCPATPAHPAITMWSAVFAMSVHIAAAIFGRSVP